tara:strand:+ start:385 stop:1086 length:702 start_codon:yes stop_codon:yes gene_type:complete
MKLGISQPTYLPWHGYFGLIDFVDEFVFLENVQFSKRSWQQRNKIRDNKGEIYLTLSVKTKNKYYQKINEVELDNFYEVKQKHLETIRQNYSNAKYFDLYFPNFQKIMEENFNKLSDLNKRLILYFCRELKINTKISTDRDYTFQTKNIEYLKDICLKKSCSTYISTEGSKKYFTDLSNFPKTDIKIKYFQFKDMKYLQCYDNFTPRLSIIDLLFNLGPESLNYIRNNFYICN